MEPRATDTSADVEARMVALYRAMDPAAKLRRVLGLIEASRSLALLALQQAEPHENERVLRRRVAARALDPDLAALVVEPD